MKNCLKGNKLLLLSTVAFSLLANVALVMTSKQYEWFFDVVAEGNLTKFIRIVLFSVTYIFAIGLLFYLYLVCSKRLIKRILSHQREKIFAGIMQKNRKSFYEQNTSEYISVLTNDCNLLEENWIKPMLGICESVGMFVATVAMLVYYSPLITLTIFLTSAIAFLIPGILGKKLSKRQKKLSDQMAAFTNRIKDAFLGFDVIQSFNMLPHIRGKFATYNEQLSKRKYETDHFKVINDTVGQILGITIQVGTSCLSAYLVIKGEISIGALAAVVQLCSRFVAPLMAIMNHLSLIKSMKPVIMKLNALSTEREIVSGRQPSFRNGIKVSDVSFSYGGRPVLDKIDLEILPGLKYAVMGESGCGKSTLIKLLLGYYSDYQGEIRYDSDNIREIDLFKLNEMAAVIAQNVYLFDDTIKYNICLQQDYSGTVLKKALRESCLDKIFRDDLDLGSQVGENGCSLSGGQRQRIAIARALIRKTPLLILDEGTSAVDLISAYEIEDALLNLEELTLISIVHKTDKRLLERYDCIIFMQDGRIMEKGTFGELMENKGDFFHFYEV